MQNINYEHWRHMLEKQEINERKQMFFLWFDTKVPRWDDKNIQDWQIFQHVKKKTLNILKKKPITNNWVSVILIYIFKVDDMSVK